MKLHDLGRRELESALGSYGLSLEIGPFNVTLRSSAAGFVDVLSLLYERACVHIEPCDLFNDFDVRLVQPWGLRRFIKPQVRFVTDSETPFEPFPLDHGFPFFEWGLNWLFSTRAHQYLMLHAAVLARDDQAMILPALPGSGKSTLCAALMLRGWRLLSDEFGLVRPETGLIEPVPRPIPLKNESIGIIRDFNQQAVLGPVYSKTRKGDVAHLRATASSMESAREPARPAWIVFPRYLAGADELLHPFARGRSFVKLIGNAFNYGLLGERGFNTAANLVENCQCWYLEFSDLDRAIKLLDEMSAVNPVTENPLRVDPEISSGARDKGS